MELTASLKFLLLFVIVGGFSFKLSAVSEKTNCLKKEREALLALKSDLIDHAGYLSSWRKEDEDCCLWRGISCSHGTGHVTQLNLSRFNVEPLGGRISPALLELQELELLDLSYNPFQETQFPSFSNASFFPKLTHLSLAESRISSTILHQLGNFSNLQFLDLSQNDYHPSNLDWLHHLSPLRYLDLSFTNLSAAKDWLQVINNLPHLQNLQLKGCSLPLHFSSINNASKSLIIVDLTGSGVSPLLYPWLCNMSSNLVGLSLSSIGLSGSVPSFLKNMVSLKHLDLSHNNFNGSIPEFFGTMCNLQTLKLRGNKFNGLVPEFHGCATKSLKILDLSANQLFGSLPDVTGLSSLKEIYLDDNLLNGSFPNAFGQPSGLAILSLSRNQLTGSLPDLSMLPSLKKLLIDQNRLSGTIPKSLGDLSELETLDASSNFFGGVMSEAHFKRVSKLLFLDFSFNSLALNLSSDWIPPFRLEYIRLSSCKLGPDFPKWLQNQSKFSWLDISGTGISGAIPHWFWDLPNSNSAVLDLSKNKMNGGLPNLTFKVYDASRIDLSSNQFEGPLPMFPSNVGSLNLAGNMFSGSVASFCKVTYGALSFLDLSNNLLSGELPECSMSWQGLKILNLANNGFSSGIPMSVGLLGGLEHLNLRNNSFSGEFPLALKNCKSLRFLDLSDNKLSGQIPVWIGERLPDLGFLSLQGNEFNGEIPLQMCHLSCIIILDLSRNNLSRSIPKCFNNFTTMGQRKDANGIFQFNSIDPMMSTSNTIALFPMMPTGIPVATVLPYTGKALVKWKGREYEYDRNLHLFRVIDLANNKLSGVIPKEIMDLSELVVLNLSANNLQGFIPENIGHLKQLQSVDLSENQLSGRIPSSIVDLSFLSYMNLSYNNLSGRIPAGTQLGTFNVSFFIGNNALCGLPLSRKCPEDVPVSPTNDGHGNNNQEEEDDDDEFWRCFYIGMGVGFAVGFWGVCGSLLLKRSWRHAYFRFLADLNDSFYVRSALLFAKMKKISNARG